jgi:acetyl-CoA synthetase (ADP-forming)
VRGITRTLSEFESKSRIELAGVTVAPQRLVATPDAAVTAAAELGYPVVVKLSGDTIAHKTERGLVRLGLTTPETVAAAAGDLLAAARPDDGEVALLVAPGIA